MNEIMNVMTNAMSSLVLTSVEAVESAGAGDHSAVRVMDAVGAVDAVSAAHPEISLGVTLLFSGILLAMVICLALEEKIHAKKSVIVGVFAVISILLATVMNIVPAATPVTLGSHVLHMPYYVTGIDWGVIAIILGSSIFVDATSKSGLFTWIAIKLTKASGGDPKKLLLFYGIMTVVFSAVLNNVTAMIIVGSLTAVSLNKLKRNDYLLGFLLTEGLLTNVGGLLTLISSVPNIIVGTAAKISFMDFFICAAPYVLVATALTLWLGAKLFKISALKNDIERAEAAQLIAGFDENDGIESKGFFKFSVVILLLFVVCIAATSAIPGVSALGMGFVVLSFALIMLLRFKATADQFYKGVDWDLLAFFMALFAIINVMEYAQVLDLIGDGLALIIALPDAAASSLVLIAAAAFSSVTDNIPLAAMLAQILGSMDATGTEPVPMTLWWSVIFGANLGGNITPIGSASTLVAVTIIHKHKLHLSFADFVKKAVPFALMQIVLAVAYVLLLSIFFTS